MKRVEGCVGCTLELDGIADVGAERWIAQGSSSFGGKLFDGDHRAVVEKRHVCLLSRWWMMGANEDLAIIRCHITQDVGIPVDTVDGQRARRRLYGLKRREHPTKP